MAFITVQQTFLVNDVYLLFSGATPARKVPTFDQFMECRRNKIEERAGHMKPKQKKSTVQDVKVI